MTKVKSSDSPTLRAQRRFFRRLAHSHGISLSKLAEESGIARSTLKTKQGRGEEAQGVMTLEQVNALAIALADEWPHALPELSLLFSPGGLVVSPDPDFAIFEEEEEAA